MTTLATSGSLTRMPRLQNQLFSVEVQDGEQWKKDGELAVFANTAFLKNQKLYHISFHVPTNSLNYSFDKGKAHRSGRLFFTEDQLAFTGTIIDESGNIQVVRGSQVQSTFHTQRAKRGEATWTKWEEFTYGTTWEDGRLVQVYKLGDIDISDRTSVVKVNGWQTTIAMVPSTGPFGKRDTFEIVVEFPGDEFAGKYTDADGVEYDWKGNLAEKAKAANRALAANFVRFDEKPINRLGSSNEFTTLARDTFDRGPSLSIQDLMSVSAITEVTVGGKTIVVDSAQVQTGKYFQQLLINGLEDKWVHDFFGDRKAVPAGVQQIMNDNMAFYKQKSVMNLGQMIKDVYGTDPSHKDLVAKIDKDKLFKAWEGLGTDKDYAKQSSPLYIQGYKDGVPGIQPYLTNDPEGWGKQLFDTITSDKFLSMWSVQVASQSFKNVKQQMYEWFVQLSILAPNKTYAQDAMNITFGVVLNVNYANIQWDEELKAFLKAAINNAKDGSTNFSDEMLKNNAEEVKNIMAYMVNNLATVDQLTDEIVNFMAGWSRRNLNKKAAEAGDEIAGELTALMDRRGVAAPMGWKARGGKIFGSIMYAAGAGFLIYQLVSQGQQPVTPESIFVDLNLALLSVGFIVKSVEKLMATGIGNYIAVRTAAATGGVRKFANNLAKWFSEEGVVVETWATKIFGKSSAEFFAKRLGPALAVLGIILSAWELANAIKSGDVRNIVFESINTFFALAAAVLIGLELMSFAWAGPVGLAVAVIGAIVALVQLLWNIFSPPPPPPDPVEQFINGPLKDQGFVRSAGLAAA